MPLRDNELARRSDGAVELRPQALRLTLSFDRLTTADAHTLAARFSCSVRVADAPADRRLFAELFLSSGDSVTADLLGEHFARPLAAALSNLATGATAADALADSSRPAWISALTRAANSVAFSAGLEILPPYQLDVESPSLQRQRLDEVVRMRAEERAAGQIQHLQHAAELLRQFQAMRQAAPDVPAGKLLDRIGPADRGAALETLLLASARQGRQATLFAVAGNALATIDASADPPSVKLIELPADLGPFRSVQAASVAGEPSLLIGARVGILVVPSEQPGAGARAYAYPSLDSPLGFNRVLCAGSEIWASHGEAGLVCWQLPEPSVAAQVIRDVSERTSAPPTGTISSIPSRPSAAGTRQVVQVGPRHLHVLDDARTLLYSIGSELILRSGDSRTAVAPQSSADVVDILASPQGMIAVHADGTLVLLDRASGQVLDTRRRSSRLTAAALMPWLGDVRLLLATEDGPIDCIGLDDPLVTEYLGPARGLKILAASTDLIAGVSPDRQRINLWRPWNGHKPLAELHVASLARHRIADVGFAS